MTSPYEIKLLEKYARGIGINIGCGNVPIGNSIGVDINPKAKAAIVQADASFLPFNDECLDYVVSSACLEHTTFAPLLVIREWLRCLKIGGVLAVCVPDGGEGTSALESNTKRGRLGQGGHTHIFTLNTLRDLIEFAGADIIENKRLKRLPYWKTGFIFTVGKKTNAYQKGEMPRSRILWMKSVLRTALPAAYIGKLRGDW